MLSRPRNSRPRHGGHIDAEAVGRHMPRAATLDDLAATRAADDHHRYELGLDGVLPVTPPPGPAHAAIAARLTG